ncbi:MAG TPA: ATP-grasp domain-containing protein [Crocinitomicaceae bacterium]|nr:ATP-grasp domain-containing protein [Crocinitomicaceae bacterium]
MKFSAAILVFGGDDLQLSIIKKCIYSNLFTVIIDPNPNAKGREIAHAFEIVEGNDFEETCHVVEKYNIKAIITAATDKPLVMMAEIAEKYNFPFFSKDTAVKSTDKYLMKTEFQKHEIPCANGFVSDSINSSLSFPIIVKPRDNSGSRGVFYCNSQEDAERAIGESLSYSKKNVVLIEEVIEGKEYSIESLHYNGTTTVIQYTEKITTPFPYNVELGHIQPAQLSNEEKLKINEIIEKTAKALKFENCASHTELKINEKGIFVIETSPRLGGDFITSALTQLSTDFDIEQALIDISLGQTIQLEIKANGCCGIFYFNLKEGIVAKVGDFSDMVHSNSIHKLTYNVSSGFEIKQIKNSLDRYGYVIITAHAREELMQLYKEIMKEIESKIIMR